MKKQKEVNAYIHTHWDREWYMEFERYRLRLVEVLDNVLLALKTKSLDWFWFDGQVAALLDYLKIRKEKKEEIATNKKKKDNAPDNAATAFSAFAIPIETPIANINGRLSNIILPQSLPTLITPYKIVPGPMIFIR